VVSRPPEGAPGLQMLLNLHLSPFVNSLKKGRKRREEVRIEPKEITPHH
jgi:hypothetical protein